MKTFDVYKDIKARTNGEIYLGVVGPVRSGKSTFIKRFMDLLVLPQMEEPYAKERTKDEIPQSASGRTIMTTEPKFVPKDAAVIHLSEDAEVKVKLIDCVGFMIKNAVGFMENEKERLVKTPWFDREIPFTKAAEIGTEKVIHDHATIGIVITTDGTIGEFAREDYLEAEKQTILELQEIGKPFLVLVNSTKPYDAAAKQVAGEIAHTYGVSAMPVNCEQLNEEDIHEMMERVLFDFSISEVEFYIPKWVEMLPRTHKIKLALVEQIQNLMQHMVKIRDAHKGVLFASDEYIESMKVEDVALDRGTVKVQVQIAQRYYYEMLSELVGTPIENEYEMIHLLKELSHLKAEYENVKDAMESVRMKGYGVVYPQKQEIHLEEPELIRQGNKYGVKIHSEAPSIHMIRANIETEIAPIVGNEEQANDLIRYIKDASQTEEGIWGTNIFGKSVEELVADGMRSKLIAINDESQTKLQDTMQKIVNDSNGGMVCIII